MLCSSSSSIHGPGTRASRAAAKRALSSGTLPRATAAATRTNAAVGAASTGPVPALIVPLPAPRSLIVSLLQSAFYTQLPYRLTPRVHVGSGGEPGRTRPETELLEHGRHGECRTDRVPVNDLERDAESLLREEGTVHTLGADLGDHAPGVRPHDLGTGPTLTGDEVWVAQHRFHDCGLRTADWTHALRIRNRQSEIRNRKSRVRQRHVSQRQPVAHDSASIHAGSDVADPDLRPATHLREAALLHGVLEPRIELRGPAVVARQCEHTGMFPRAVRVDSRKP